MTLAVSPSTGLFLAILLSAAPDLRAADLWQALSSGKPDLHLRYRFEAVDDNRLPRVSEAHANTLRTALGYSTGLFHGFGAQLQIEDVRVVDDDTFADGGANGVTDRATVVDPAGTEIQQAKLRYRGLPRTTLWIGRQEIEHRVAPLHRYLGNILWRQNWQTFDALRVVNDSLPATHVDYAYIWNVNRVFGEDNPLADRSDFRSDSHALNISYAGFPWGRLETYAYLLNFDSREPGTRALGTATGGLRLQGQRALGTRAAKLLYTMDYARQTDRKDNPADIGVNYAFGELGLQQAGPWPWLESLTIKAAGELLEGDGPQAVPGGRVARAFQTPLGTNHAFQGWADRFLLTPADGIVDLSGTVIAMLHGAQLMLTYHDFDADRDGYAYGTEWDVQLTRVFREHYTGGLKYAAYDADRNALNLARNGATSSGRQAFDLNVFWAWVEVRF